MNLANLAKFTPNPIYCKYDEEAIPDWRKASFHNFPPEGIVVVEMIPAKNKTAGGILLHELTLQTHYGNDDYAIGGIEPSVGVVIGLGPDIEDLNYGDLVLCRDGDGYCIEGFTAGEYEAQGEVRIFGNVHPVGSGEAYVEPLPHQESIFAVIEDGYRPLRGNILIRKDPFEQKSGSILLPTFTQIRDGKGEILALGPDCKLEILDPLTLEPRKLRVGDRVVYRQDSLWNFVDSEDTDLAFLRESAVLLVETQPGEPSGTMEESSIAE